MNLSGSSDQHVSLGSRLAPQLQLAAQGAGTSGHIGCDGQNLVPLHKGIKPGQQSIGWMPT
jgi:hypothetical protein